MRISLPHFGLPVIAAALILAPAVGIAQDAAPAAAETTAALEVAPGTVASYTDEQAKRGKKAYADNCAGCHGTTLGGSGEAPTVVGEGFRERWFVGSPEPIYDYISSNMPQGAGGSLPADTYADIVAYLMSKNKVPAGDAELPHDTAELANVVLPPLTE